MFFFVFFNINFIYQTWETAKFQCINEALFSNKNPHLVTVKPIPEPMPANPAVLCEEWVHPDVVPAISGSGKVTQGASVSPNILQRLAGLHQGARSAL